MRREHRYTVTHTSHLDFGQGAQDVIAHLSIVPDGTGWAKRSPTLTLKIEPDELAIGETVRLTIEREEPEVVHSGIEQLQIVGRVS